MVADWLKFCGNMAMDTYARVSCAVTVELHWYVQQPSPALPPIDPKHSSMDENASGIVWLRESIGRQTLSQLDSGVDASRDLGLARSFYNGFEMWWLAGMPITLVFVLTLLSFSLASGVSGLGKSVRWHRVLPVSVWRLVGWLSGLLRAGFAALEKKTARASMLRDAGETKIPGHIAVIMDGNRRYGKSKYGAGVRGHSDGSRTLVNFTDWCIDAGIKALTVFAFSTGEVLVVM